MAGAEGTLKGQYVMLIKTEQMVRIPVNTFAPGLSFAK